MRDGRILRRVLIEVESGVYRLLERIPGQQEMFGGEESQLGLDDDPFRDDLARS
jgi:hypothetical protein